MDTLTEPSAATGLADKIAAGYYKTTAVRGHTASREYYEYGAAGLKLKLQQWLPRNKEAYCLDLACGCGEFVFLLESLGFRNTTGVDICEEELQAARQYVNGGLTTGDVLEFLKAADSASIDFISALNLLEHLTKDKLLELLIECHRVLRSGGTFVAMVPNAVSPFGSLTRHWDITHEWAFTTNNFRQLASLIGFNDEIEFRECGPRVHGVLSAIRYTLWQVIRGAIAAWFMIELGTTKDGIYTMDMLVRLRKE